MKSKGALIGIAIMLSLLMFGCGTVSNPALTSAHTYVGSVNSTVYHYPSCTAAKRIKEANQVWFSDVSEAKKAGYVPCRVCKPPSN